MKTLEKYSNVQITWFVILRVFIGWHFLYEGMVKVLNPHWTSLPYLLDSKGWFSEFFIKLANNSDIIGIVNIVNEWSLVLIGLGLLLGFFSRLASYGGVVLLALYSLSHPSFIGADYMMPFEGTYLWIDKNLVEMVALIALSTVPTSHIIGLDHLLVNKIPNCFTKYKLF